MKKIINEIWKPIESIDDYSISSIGRVKRNFLVITQNNQHGSFKRELPERILKNSKDKYGYHRVVIKRKGYFLHRLVAIAFISNPENKLEINHINGIKVDNRVNNLEWATHKENMRHALENKLNANHRGINNKYYQSTIMSEDEVIEAKKIYNNDNTSFKKLSEKYNVSKSTIMRVIKKQ